VRENLLFALRGGDGFVALCNASTAYRATGLSVY